MDAAKYIGLVVVLVILLLSGCHSGPRIFGKFPNAPIGVVGEPCPNLYETKPESQSSDILMVIAKNYSMYYECAAKLDAWTKWYKDEKGNFNSR